MSKTYKNNKSGVTGVHYKTRDARWFASISVNGEKIEKEKGSISICYIAPNEDVWSIAKRYHVSVAHIDAVNRTNGTLSEKGYIII